MSRCQYCRKKGSIMLTCKACDLVLCSRCIDMTIHNCTKIDEYKTEKRKSLENTLVKNKTTENKRLHT
jgi:hypothetical protein